MELKAKKLLTPANMTKIAVLSAVAFILGLEGIFRWRLPIFPAFLALDVSDIPALIGAVTLGPIAGIWIVGLGNILNVVITGTSSMGIGPFANFVVGSAYILPTAYVYNRMGGGLKGFSAGAAVGVVFAASIASLMNITVMIPAYAYVLGIPIETIIGMGTALNSNIDSLVTLVLFSIAPFNLLKFTLVSIGGFVIIKAFEPVLAMIAKKS